MTAPIASYRFQLVPEAGSRLDDVTELLDHLRALGVSHVYLSPVADAVPGSSHGYDVVDHTRVREELGGSAALERLFSEAHRRGLAVVIDHVPNHVSVSRPELQRAWWEMLRDGPNSPSARWFDVDPEVAGGRVVVPVLGAPLDQVLAEGGVEVRGDRLVVGGGYELPLAADDGSGTIAEVLARQHYELVHWREPVRNVRRFFTIDDLVAVQVEHRDVAEAVDALPIAWSGVPGFGGLRIDHVDGLTDPLGYLREVRGRLGADAWLLVEKILAPDEWLPDAWPVDGTTGYETTRTVEHVLVDPAGGAPLDALWSWVGGGDYEALEDEARREVLDAGLRPDLERTVRAAAHALGIDPADRSLTADLERVLIELTVALPRYRTYLPEDPVGAEVLQDAANRASERAGSGLVETVVGALLDPTSDAEVAFRDRWQRLTGPAMAKGAEDRAFFRYLRLASLCEVGGEPGAYGMPVAELQDRASQTQRRWPRTMVAGSTHDAKRSADVRARSTALTWHAEDWVAQARAWIPELVDHGVTAVDALHALQTVVACPGLDAERLGAFSVKAAREADRWTSWIDPDEAYERALTAVAAELTSPGGVGASVAAWARRLDDDGTDQALVSLVLRLMLPGIPDLYQGAEAFTFRLTDPDNRVAPDRERLAGLVHEAADLDLPGALALHPEVSRAVVISRLLALRRSAPAAFAPDARFASVPLTGPSTVTEQVVAFERRSAASAGPAVRVVARTWPRSAAERMPIGEVTVRIPPGTWASVLVDDAPPIDAGARGADVALEHLLGGSSGIVPAAVIVRRP